MKSDDKNVGSFVSLGNGYKAVIRETVKGKRWVIEDEMGRTVPNAPFHHYIEDARKYYNQWLKNKPTSQQVVDENLSKGNDTIQQALSDQQGLTEEQAKYLQKKSAILNEAKRISDLQGIPYLDLIREWQINGLPENLQELYPEGIGDARLYNELVSIGKGEGSLYDAVEDIENIQKQRDAILEEHLAAKEQRNDALAAELGLMTDEETGIPSHSEYYNRLTPEQKAHMTPDMLQNLVRLKQLEDLKARGRDQGMVFDKGLPTPEQASQLEAYDMSAPTKQAEELYSKLQPNLNYISARPYNDLQHQLANTGAGSPEDSAWGLAERDKQYAMRSEDISNMTNLTNMFATNARTYGDWWNNFDNIAKSARSAIADPLKTEGDVMNPAYERQDRKEYNQGILNQNDTEAALKVADANAAGDQEVHRLREQARMQQQAEGQQLANSVYEFQMLAKDIDKLSGEQQQKYAALQEDIWNNRARIITMLRQEGRAQEAFELEKAAADKREFMQKVALIGKIGLSVGMLAASGGSAAPGVAAMWAPQAAQYFGQNSAGKRS